MLAGRVSAGVENRGAFLRRLRLPHPVLSRECRRWPGQWIPPSLHASPRASLLLWTDESPSRVRTFSSASIRSRRGLRGQLSWSCQGRRHVTRDRTASPAKRSVVGPRGTAINAACRHAGPRRLGTERPKRFRCAVHRDKGAACTL